MSNWAAVFYTEGGGIAVLRGDSYVWEVPPKWMKDARAGDPIPDEMDRRRTLQQRDRRKTLRRVRSHRLRRSRTLRLTSHPAL